MVEGTAHAQRLGLRLSVGHQAATRVKPTSRHHDLVPSTEPEASTGFGGAGESPASAALLGLFFFFFSTEFGTHSLEHATHPQPLFPVSVYEDPGSRHHVSF